MKTFKFLILICIVISCSPKPQAKTELKPSDFFSLISQEKMERYVSIIASDSTQGRGFGTDGLKKAAQFVANTYESVGLKPVNERSGSNPFYQPVVEIVDGQDIQSQNVLGIIEGSDDQLHWDSVQAAW